MFNFIRKPRRQAFRLSPIGGAIISGVLMGGAVSTAQAMEEGATPSAQARYEADRKACLSGQSAEGQATCLKEAGAALAAARSGELTSESEQQLNQNALMHCQLLPADDRANCRTLARRNAATHGMVQDDEGVRELVTLQPATESR